jgi:hypothetical protein
MWYTSSGSWRALSLALLLLGVLGCGPSMYPVRGKVILNDGTPVTTGMVIFESKGEKPIVARGDIKPDGSYELSTNKPGDGVPPGKYRVHVTPPVHVNVEESAPKPVFDERYTKFETSGLEFEVPSGSGEYLIKLDRRKK